MSELVHILNNDLTPLTKERVRKNLINRVDELMEEPSLSSTKVSFLLAIGANAVQNRMKHIDSLDDLCNAVLDKSRWGAIHPVDKFEHTFLRLTPEQKEQVLARLLEK